MRFSLFSVVLLIWCATARAQDDALPLELAKTFEQYTRAWTGGDWGRIFDLNAPEYQKKILKQFESRDAWIKHQSADFKDTVLSMERKSSYRLDQSLYSFAIVTRARRSNGEEFSVNGWATFEWMNGKWYLVDPVVPGGIPTVAPSTSNPKPKQPATQTPSR